MIAGDELGAFARMVRGVFARRGARWDLDEVEQDAAISALELHEKTGLPLAGNRGYYFRAAVCDAGLAMARRIAAVSVSEHAVRGGTAGWKAGNGGWTWGNRVPVDKCANFFSSPASADERLVQEECTADRARLMRILGERIEQLPRRDHRPLRLILGIGGAEPVEPARAATMTRRTRAAVTASARRLKAAVQNDQEARGFRRVTLDR
ncbi:MAG: hypothetical protein V4537_14395 [Pseudomonadota bacterium]